MGTESFDVSGCYLTSFKSFAEQKTWSRICFKGVVVASYPARAKSKMVRVADVQGSVVKVMLTKEFISLDGVDKNREIEFFNATFPEPGKILVGDGSFVRVGSKETLPPSILKDYAW